MPDSSATRRRYSQPRRQGNPERREVWRVMQAEGRNLGSRWSFKDKLGREFIARWSFKEDSNVVNRDKVLQEKKGALGKA